MKTFEQELEDLSERVRNATETYVMFEGEHLLKILKHFRDKPFTFSDGTSKPLDISILEVIPPRLLVQW